MSTTAPSTLPHLRAWHELVEARDPAGLDAILADDVVFHSPVVHTPQEGKEITTRYLAAAIEVLMGGGFRYVRELASEREASLEFVTEVDGLVVNGVDLITWNDEGRITDFKVLIRPKKAIDAVHRAMGAELQRMMS